MTRLLIGLAGLVPVVWSSHFYHYFDDLKFLLIGLYAVGCALFGKILHLDTYEYPESLSSIPIFPSPPVGLFPKSEKAVLSRKSISSYSLSPLWERGNAFLCSFLVFLRQAPRNRWLKLSWGLFLLSGFLALFFAINPWKGLGSLSWWLTLSIVCFASSTLSEKERLLLLKVSAGAALCVVLYGWLQILGFELFWKNLHEYPISTLGYKNMTAEFLLFAIPLFVFFLFRAFAKKKIPFVLFWGLLAAAALTHLYFTYSRSCQLGFAVAAFFLLLVQIMPRRLRSRRASLRAPLLVSFLVVVAAYGMITFLLEWKNDLGVWWRTQFSSLLMGEGSTPSDREQRGPIRGEGKIDFAGTFLGPVKTASSKAVENRSWSLRIARWENSLAIIRDHPLGIGSGNFEEVYPLYARKWAADLEENEALIVDHSHNEYLQIFVEHGIVGGLVFALFIFLILWRIGRLFLTENASGEERVVGFFLISIAVTSFFSFSPRNPVTGMEIAIAVGWVLFPRRVLFKSIQINGTLDAPLGGHPLPPPLPSREREDEIAPIRSGERETGIEGRLLEISHKSLRFSDKLQRYWRGQICVARGFLAALILFFVLSRALASFFLEQSMRATEEEKVASAAAASGLSVRFEPWNPLQRFIHCGNLALMGEARAIEECERLLELSPHHYFAHAYLGYLFHGWGERERAEQHYLRALELLPDFQKPRDLLARLKRGESP